MKKEGYPNSDFFILDSEMPLDKLSEFYGYWYDEKTFNVRTNPRCLLDKLTSGAFVNIQTEGNKVIIQQDYNCSYGVFIYQAEKYWAISNSFYMLTRYLSNKVTLTLNDEYLELFLYGIVPPVLKETAIKEIEELAQGEYIEILFENKLIFIKDYSYDKFTIPVVSEQGLNIVDAWHHKYSTMIQGIYNHGYEITADLSGGFDTRAALSVLFHPNIADAVTVYAPKDDLSWHVEDYKIASKIIDIYRLRRGEISTRGIPMSSYHAILNSLNCRLLSSNQICFKSVFFQKPVFNLNGIGASIRGIENGGTAYAIAVLAPNRTIFGRKVGDKARRCAWRSASQIMGRYKENVPPQQKIYDYSNSKNHFGRSIIEGFQANLISIHPLLDPMLRKLDIAAGDPNRNILMALIYTRYMPETRNIEFNGRRSIAENIWARVEEFSRLHPMPAKAGSEPFTIHSTVLANRKDDVVCQRRSPLVHYLEIFKSESVKKFIAREYGEEIHKSILNDVKEDQYQGFHNITRAMSQWFLEQSLENHCSCSVPYAHLYMRDSLTSDLCCYCPGINIKIYFKPELEACEQTANIPFLDKRITESPYICTFRVLKEGFININISPPYFMQKSARFPFMIDITSFSIVDATGNSVYSITDRNFVDQSGLYVALNVKAEDQLTINLYWCPNEVWYFDHKEANNRLEKEINVRQKREIIPGADRITNLFNM